MNHENFSIEIDGEEISDMYQNIHSFEVELDNELAGMFRLTLAIERTTEGLWSAIDDERFVVWKEVKISAGFNDSIDELFLGYITHVRPEFNPDITQCVLNLWGIDKSILMDREEKLKDWPDKKDSDIASEIFQQYGFTPDVEDTSVVHDSTVSTIIQRETDMHFLRRLAKRNGYECYVDGSTGYFKKPQLDQTPQTTLAVHFGDERNVNQFSLEVDAQSPTNVDMYQIDKMNKEILHSSIEESEQTTLGSTDSSGILQSGIDPGKITICGNHTTSQEEMDILCKGLLHDAEWFVQGEGEIDGNRYGEVLKPRETVTIKGIGETYSGVYYVTHVTHSFTPDGYLQFFKVKRNALMPLGDENF